jgi:hypothetical protein
MTLFFCFFSIFPVAFQCLLLCFIGFVGLNLLMPLWFDLDAEICVIGAFVFSSSNPYGIPMPIGQPLRFRWMLQLSRGSLSRVDRLFEVHALPRAPSDSSFCAAYILGFNYNTEDHANFRLISYYLVVL